MFANYPQYEYHFAQVQLILFMLGMGATLRLNDFTAIVREPRYFAAGAAGQFLVTPLLAVLVNRWFDLSPGIAVGLILVAAMPGGTLSKVFTYLGKGNIALSIALTGCGTLAAMVLVPLLLRTLAAGYVPAEFEMPVGRVMLDLALYLLLPLCVGMLLSRLAVPWRFTFSKWCIRLGFVVVVVMVTGSLASGRIRPAELGWKVPLAIILFCVLAQQAVMLPFRVLRWPRADCLSVGVEATMRNLNLALLLKALLFPVSEKGTDALADGVLFVILFYAGVAMIVALPLALRFRRMARREELAKPQAVAVASDE
ncbi:MAG: bile acid:sodium symporter [Planctomycetia bacterium]|nr:bile acid:sodium symporter [Planctomycetia bacterium]